MARCGGRRMSVFGPQHLEDHHGLVDVGGDRRAVRDVVGARAAGRPTASAPATISSPLRARSAAAASTSASSTRSVTSTASREVEDQPADAAVERGVDAAAQLAALSSARRWTSIWCTTSSSRCSRKASEPGLATARRDWEVNMAGRRRGTRRDGAYFPRHEPVKPATCGSADDRAGEGLGAGARASRPGRRGRACRRASCAGRRRRWRRRPGRAGACSRTPNALPSSSMKPEPESPGMPGETV